MRCFCSALRPRCFTCAEQGRWWQAENQTSFQQATVLTIGVIVPDMKELAFTSVLERSGNRLWSCHFRVPSGIVHKLVGTDSRRVVCTLNASVKYQCAVLPRGNGIFVITVNKKIRDSLGLSYGMQVHVCLEKDTSRYGLPMPEELHELLRQDSEGRFLFHALTRGEATHPPAYRRCGEGFR